MTSQFKNVLQVLDHFKNEATCKEYLVQQRWNGQPICPHCGVDKTPYVTNRGYKCSDKDCYKKFSVTTGTILENTKISLRYWFATIYLATAHKKGISSLQLSRDLGITQKTAWFLLHRVREMFKVCAPEMLKGMVEVDETYVGGKNINRHHNKKTKLGQGRGGGDKVPVIGLAERGGSVKTYVVENTESRVMFPIVTDNVDRSAKLITDSYTSYKSLNKLYNHVTVKHTNYITIGEDHTNTIEGFWSLLKRGIVGIYHQVSPKHLHRYCNEFGYRYNSRQISDCNRFEEAVKNVNNIRLTYEKLIS